MGWLTKELKSPARYAFLGCRLGMGIQLLRIVGVVLIYTPSVCFADI
jgi:hypothetical protein